MIPSKPQKKQAEEDKKRATELEKKQEEARKCQERETEERWAAEKAHRIAQLQQQRADVQSELANLKGLFTGKRRREIEAQLTQIEKELKGLN